MGDDFWAIAMLLTDGFLDVRYIITSSGDTRAKARILAKFLTQLGRDDIRIGIGLPTVEDKWFLMGPDGQLFGTNTWSPEAVPNPILKTWSNMTDLSSYRGGYDADGITGLSAAVKAAPNATYLSLGGSANAAALVQKDADLFRSKGTHGVFMGGTLNSSSEWNFGLSPVHTRRVLAAFDDPVTVAVEVCETGKLILGNSRDRHFYSRYLSGGSLSTMVLSNVQLALANYGAHKEVANGTTDVLYDSVASYWLTPTGASSFSVVRGRYNVTDSGKLVAVEAGIPLTVAFGWKAGALDEFKRVLSTSIAAGHMPGTPVGGASANFGNAENGSTVSGVEAEEAE